MADVHDVASAVLARTGSIQTMKLEKLVYYSQAWHLAIFGKPLFEAPTEAWKDGPVVDELFQLHKGQFHVRTWNGHQDQLEAYSIQLIEMVCTQYGHMSGDELSDLTHHEKPWKDARGDLKPNQHSREVISTEVMARFYRTRTLCGHFASDLASAGIFNVPSGASVTTSKDYFDVLNAGTEADTPVIGIGQNVASSEIYSQIDLAKFREFKSRRVAS